MQQKERPCLLFLSSLAHARTWIPVEPSSVSAQDIESFDPLSGLLRRLEAGSETWKESCERMKAFGTLSARRMLLPTTTQALAKVTHRSRAPGGSQPAGNLVSGYSPLDSSCLERETHRG